MKEGAKRMQQERNIVCQIRKRRSRIEYTRKEEGGGGEWDKVETAASLARWTEPGTDLILEHVFTANKPTTFSPPLYPLCFTLSSSLVQTAQRDTQQQQQQTYKLWRSRRQHMQHITTRSGLKRGVTLDVRENWHAIATRSHSLATSRWCDNDNDEHTTAGNALIVVYNALHQDYQYQPEKI